MDEATWVLISIVGPAILMIAVLWVAYASWRRGRPEEVETSERATHDLYEEEEERRREGTDGL